MSVTVKSQREIELMREAGKILGTVLNELEKECKPGVTTYHINKIGEEMIKSYGCIPSFKGYQGYPAAICVSVNDEIVHGIPSKKRVLKEGDIVSLDAGVIHKGYHSDAARTYGIGKISDEAAKLIEVTRQSFFEGIKYAKEGCHLYEISNAIAQYNESFGYGVIRDLVGHGIGTELHEEPEIPNFRQDRRGIRLYEGMTLAIEPMVSAGDYKVRWLDDNWTASTFDHSLSAHYENTVLVTGTVYHKTRNCPALYIDVKMVDFSQINNYRNKNGSIYYPCSKCKKYNDKNESSYEYVYVTDGRLRQVDEPKKKKLKHIQLIKICDDTIKDKISRNIKLTNEDIKLAIKKYNNR